MLPDLRKSARGTSGFGIRRLGFFMYPPDHAVTGRYRPHRQC